MNELIIETEDKKLYEDIRTAKIQGLTIARRVFNCDSADVISTIPSTTIIVIIAAVGTTAGNLALNLFSSWLYDRSKKKKPTIQP